MIQINMAKRFFERRKTYFKLDVKSNSKNIQCNSETMIIHEEDLSVIT